MKHLKFWVFLLVTSAGWGIVNGQTASAYLAATVPKVEDVGAGKLPADIAPVKRRCAGADRIQSERCGRHYDPERFHCHDRFAFERIGHP